MPLHNCTNSRFGQAIHKIGKCKEWVSGKNPVDVALGKVVKEKKIRETNRWSYSILLK